MLNTLVIILILIACILLIGAVLIQNPKGGGLSQSFGGFSNQIMGVQRTTDFLEKATWGLIITIAVLSLFTVFFVGKQEVTQATGPKSRLEGIEASPATARPAAPQQQAPPANKPQQAAPPAGQPAAQPAGGQPAPQPK
jgi:preprotein translocase subunit SecG